MDVQSPTDRVLRSLVAAVTLSGLCFGYIQFCSQWLDVERSVRRRPVQASQAEVISVADESVLQWFPESAWVRQANKSFRNDRQYLFFNTQETTEVPAAGPAETAGQLIDLKPVAMLWKNQDPDVKPIVVTADSARLTLSERFSAKNSSVGRIINGWLTGNVVIQGPKGLHITGHEFSVDEISMKLKSFNRVDFHWESHSGYADNGVEILLEPDSENAKGLTSVNTVTAVKMNGPVVCSLQFDEPRNQNGTELEIVAPGSFVFDLRTNRGIFYGMRGGNDYRQTDVRVKRMTDGEPDRMYSPELHVAFYQNVLEDTGRANISRLHLGKVSARGVSKKIVRYYSTENDIKAGMMQLDYQVGARQLDMYGSLQSQDSSKRQQRKLSIQQNGRVLRVPHLRLLHGEGTGVERIECIGPGSIFPASLGRPGKSRWNVGDRDIAASVLWTRHLNVRRQAAGKSCTVTIAGGGKVSLPDRQMKIEGRTIKLRLDAAEQVPTGRQSRTPPELSLNVADLRPEKLVAQGNVIVRSPRVSGELKDQLTVYFHPNEDSVKRNISVISQTKELSGSNEKRASQTESRLSGDQGHSTFFGREMTAKVVLSDDSSGQQRWSHIRLAGDVIVQHQGIDPKDAYTAEGSTFIAENGVGDQADIKLFGNPAMLRSSTGHVTGLRIDLHQAEGVAEINGGGKLEMVIDQDFDGQQLPSPVPIKIRWTDYMNVRGKRAHFVGGIRVDVDELQYAVDDPQVHDAEIRTPELMVFFADAINLAGSQNSERISVDSVSSSDSPEIERIRCVGETLIHRESFTDGELDGLLNAKMVDLELEPGTGKFSAIGPGYIESTTTNTKSGPVTQIRVESNRRTEIGRSPLVRLRASFIGQMEGSLNDRDVSLRNFVTIAFVPVQELDEKIDLESLPAETMPEDSRLLQAEEVYIESVPGADGDEFSVTAVGDAQLESRDLSGDADRISYDRSKSQITLTAENGRLVNLRQRLGGTGQFRIVSGPRYQYNLETQGLSGRNFKLDVSD
ncbi:MAG: hypothetical protein MK110_05335 [Fuerstiella sp.]|nr:hypothetical protein [Fuerstiella sp.]